MCFFQVQEKFFEAMKRNSMLESTKSSASESKSSGGSSAEVEALREELALMKKDSAKKINDSVQFKQMKKLLMSKNALVKEMHERLSKYEKSELPAADMDDEI